MNRKSLFDQYKIPKDKLDLKLEDATLPNAMVLFIPERIDLVAKYIYINSLVENVNLEFSKELYASHIDAFTHGRYTEPGQETSKNSLESFFISFDKLIKDIEQNGFDAAISRVPIGCNGVLMDGAHRTAVCGYFGLPIEITKFETPAEVYDYKFFRSRFLASVYSDYMAFRYVKIKKKGIYTVCLWPTGYSKKQEVIKFLTYKTSIVCEKEITLTSRGAHSFVAQIYSHHDWVGTPVDSFKGARNKAENCFKKKAPMTLFVVESDASLTEILAFKDEIRNFFDLGKHSVHITDTFEEAEQVAELLLNENSVYQMNYGNPFKNYRDVQRLLDFRKFLVDNGLDSKELIVDGSGPMAIFGLRKASDIDFISKQEVVSSESYSKRPESELLKLYGNASDRLNSPKNFFYFFGLKFLTLEMVYESKKRRNEKKDRMDATLINNFLKSNSVGKKAEFIFAMKRSIAFYKRNSRRILGLMLRKIGLFKVVRGFLEKRQTPSEPS